MIKMKAQVIYAKNTAFAVYTEYGYTVFNSDDDIEKGDILVGDLDTHGDETLYNETQGCNVDVYIEGIHCTKANAEQILRNIS